MTFNNLVEYFNRENINNIINIIFPTVKSSEVTKVISILISDIQLAIDGKEDKIKTDKKEILLEISSLQYILLESILLRLKNNNLYNIKKLQIFLKNFTNLIYNGIMVYGIEDSQTIEVLDILNIISSLEKNSLSFSSYIFLISFLINRISILNKSSNKIDMSFISKKYLFEENLK